MRLLRARLPRPAVSCELLAVLPLKILCSRPPRCRRSRCAPYTAPMTQDPVTQDQTLTQDDRARLDQVFMQVVLDVQAQVQQTEPPQSGNLAAMFHKETVSDALQGCAMLIAGWNENRVDGAGVQRSAKALRALGLEDLE